MDAKPPSVYTEFVTRFPALGDAWEAMRRGTEEAGPLTARELRLVKLGIAIGAFREGPVHSATRRALGDGVAREELEQVVAAAASTIGLPASVAAWTWIRDVLEDA